MSNMTNRDSGFPLEPNDTQDENSNLQNGATFFAEHNQAGNFLEFLTGDRHSNKSEWIRNADINDSEHNHTQSQYNTIDEVRTKLICASYENIDLRLKECIP